MLQLDCNPRQFLASNLDNKDFFGKSDPYIEIAREDSDRTWNTVYRTDVIYDNLNPRWPAFEISSTKLCNGDRQRKLRGMPIAKGFSIAGGFCYESSNPPL